MPDELLASERTAVLLQHLREGSQVAADVVFARYVARLSALVRSRLAKKIAHRVDVDDITMSAWRSFFVGAHDGRWTCTESGDLWRLLVQIALNKLYRTVTHETARKRDVDREISAASAPLEFLCDNSPQNEPAAAAELADLIEEFLRRLSERERTIVEQLLRGFEQREIASQLSVHPKTVSRDLQQIRETLLQLSQQHATEPDASDPPHVAANIFQAQVLPESLDRTPITSDVEWPVSEFLISDLRLERLIGFGSFSKVYRGTHLPTQQPCAIKMLRKHWLQDLLKVHYFRREAQIAKQLQHPHIVKTWGFGSGKAASLWIVQDLLHSDLQTARAAVGQFSVERALQLTRQAAEALAYAHSRGLVHCDIKPANLLLSQNEDVLVTDFGMACWLTPESQSEWMRGGTPAWMAPELIADCWGDPSEATDVYGLAATLYTLLVGRPPFDGDDVPAVLALVIGGSRPPSLSSCNRSVSVDLSALCEQCLQRAPRQRLQSMAEFIVELDRLGTRSVAAE